MYWRRSRDRECPRSVFQVYGTRQGKKELRRKLKLGLMHLFLSIQPIQDPSEYRQRQQTKGMTLKMDQKNVLCKEAQLWDKSQRLLYYCTAWALNQDVRVPALTTTCLLFVTKLLGRAGTRDAAHMPDAEEQ